MKAQDLRIGNWVLYDEKVYAYGITTAECQVDLSMLIGMLESSDYIDMIQPIPLTEEWLLKLGWVWNKETNSYEKYPNGDARMHLDFNDVSNSYTMFNYVLKAMIVERIFYVHQLQNLYFALTGEELKIKE